MPPGLSPSDFYYILPELVLTAGALLVLIADVLLPRRSRGALAWVTLLALGATLASLVPFTSTHVEVAHGLIAVDQFALFFKVVFLVAAAITVLMSVRYLEIEGAQPRRVLLPDPLRHARHDDHGGRHRSHHDLHRPRDDGRVVLHPGRLHQAEPAVERSGGEVFPARRLLARHPALRHVADVRPVGHDEPARDGDGVCRPGARSAPRPRRDPRRRRHRLQDRRGAVPHVGARRLRRRADAGHGVPVGRLEGGVVRDAAADLPRRAAVDERRLAAAVRGAGRSSR